LRVSKITYRWPDDSELIARVTGMTKGILAVALLQNAFFMDHLATHEAK
jgi:hypothetical protein